MLLYKLKYAIIYGGLRNRSEPFWGSIGFESGTVPEPF